MSIGLGIHGEPGVSETELGSANDVAKTLVDSLAPLVEAFAETEGDFHVKAAAALRAGDEGAESTANLVAKVGRARPLGEKSLGTPDPGAISLVRVSLVVAENL